MYSLVGLYKVIFTVIKNFFKFKYSLKSIEVQNVVLFKILLNNKFLFTYCNKLA